MSLIPFPIMAYSKGLVTNVKPVFIPDQAWSQLENSYCFRDRMLKREGNQILGRLQRNSISVASLNLSGGSVNLLTALSLESTGTIVPGSISITNVDQGSTYTDASSNSILTGTGGTPTGGIINYATGLLTITAGGSSALTGTFDYYPGLPVMGIWQRDLSLVNETQTLFFDTKYVYEYNGTSFQEYITGTTFSGTNYDFFWAYNYQGAAGTSLLFVTNDNYTSASSYDPMYYTNGSSWTSFTPALTSTTSLFQALILIPYYGRLLALNTWEGPTSGGTSATNYYNRCRFSGLVDPTGSTAWRTDIFGLGGYLDAPTAESITGCTFVKNTLIVDFDYSTWQLRYVGEYGLPFIWERVSSDFGSGSTFSGVLFDNYRLNIGDVGITQGNSIEVNRIDLDIPDQVFNIQNEQTNQGSQRVWGIRDFQRELVFWCYPDSQSQSSPGTDITYPNKVLVYNYRNQTWSIFRDNVTAFGTYQSPTGVTWSSTNIYWDNEEVTWDDPITQPGFPAIVKGNQQGFIHIYGNQTEDDYSLFVTAIAETDSQLQITVPNHNLFTGEIIYLQGLLFVNSSTLAIETTSLNDSIYQVQVIDINTLALAVWNFTTQQYEQNFSYTPTLSTSTYTGGGLVTLFPKPSMVSKDINLFQKKGMQTKLSRLDFLLQPQPDAAVTINLLLNSSYAFSANILLTPKTLGYGVSNQLSDDASDYLWYSYYQTLSAQYFRIQLTYDDNLMNTLTTHQSNLTLYAINSWVRPGGRFANPS
jgi:hypothetical protein